MRLLAVGLTTLGISAVFVGMIWNFLTALFLAAIFSAMAAPLHRRVLAKVGGRSGIATTITLLLLVAVVLVPTLALIYLAAAQANELTQDVVAFVKNIDTDLTKCNEGGSGSKCKMGIYIRTECGDAQTQLGCAHAANSQDVAELTQTLGPGSYYFFVDDFTQGSYDTTQRFELTVTSP